MKCIVLLAGALACVGWLQGQMVPSSSSVADTTGTPTVTTTPGGGQSFHPGIKYLGGVGFPDLKGHESWDNTLILTSDSVVCEFADKSFHRVAFPTNNVAKIQYGQAATRHVGRWVAIGVLVAPVALLGLFHKSRHHFVAVTWMDGDHERGVYLEANKELFRPLLNTLSYRSAKPVYADEKERQWLMTQGVAAQLDPDSKDSK